MALACSRTRPRGRPGAWRTHGCKGGPFPNAHPSQRLASHPRVPVDTQLRVASPSTPPALSCEQPRIPGRVSAQEPGKEAHAGEGGEKGPEASGTRRGPRDSALRESSPPRAGPGSAAALPGWPPAGGRVSAAARQGNPGRRRFLARHAGSGTCHRLPRRRPRCVVRHRQRRPRAPITSDWFSQKCHLHCLTGHPARPSGSRLSDSWLVRGGRCVTAERTASTASREAQRPP